MEFIFILMLKIDPETAKMTHAPAPESGNTTRQEAQLYGMPNVTIKSQMFEYLHI